MKKTENTMIGEYHIINVIHLRAKRQFVYFMYFTYSDNILGHSNKFMSINMKFISTVLIIICCTGFQSNTTGFTLDSTLINFLNQYNELKNEGNVSALRIELRTKQKYFFDKNSKIEYRKTEIENVFTNMHYYVLSNDFESFKNLYDSSKERLNESLLRFSSYFGELKFVDFLVKQRVSLEATDELGNTALINSIGRSSISLLLIKNGANVDYRNSLGFGLLEFSIVGEKYDYLLKLLNGGVKFCFHRNELANELLEPIQDLKLIKALKSSCK